MECKRCDDKTKIRSRLDYSERRRVFRQQVSGFRVRGLPGSRLGRPDCCGGPQAPRAPFNRDGPRDLTGDRRELLLRQNRQDLGRRNLAAGADPKRPHRQTAS